MTRMKPVLQGLLLCAVYSLLSWTVMAEEPLSKAGKPQKAAAPANEELTSSLTKVDVNPVARDEEIIKRLQNILDATNCKCPKRKVMR